MRTYLLLFKKPLVIPPSLGQETVQRIHAGHQRIVRCRMRAKMSVWWPGISQIIAYVIDHCPVCAQITPHRRGPMILHPYQHTLANSGNRPVPVCRTSLSPSGRLFFTLPRGNQTQYYNFSWYHFHHATNYFSAWSS